MIGTGSQTSVGLVGSAASLEGVRKALEASGERFDWKEGDEAWTAGSVLWVVDVGEGVTDEERERVRIELQRAAVRLVVFIDGIDRVPADEPFVPDLVILDVEELLGDINRRAVILQGSARRALDDPDSEWERRIRELSERLGEPVRKPASFGLTRGSEPALERVETSDSWVVPVLYGTDRKPTGDTAPEKFFRADRGSLSFGVVKVSLPKKREKGEIPKPKYWKFWESENAARHVLLLSVDPLEREGFTAELRDAVKESKAPEALLFIHGFNVTFAAAAERAAQVAFDLEFEGVPLVYSWPSEGKTQCYTVDEANIEWTVPHFREFLRLVLAESGAETVHVIAHSMGNRALVRILESLQIQEGWASLRQIVFAAPDIDRDTFVELAAKFQGRAERFTLYGSSNDRALKASRIVHKHPRAGESGNNIALVEHVDSIDSSAVDTSLLGHSYFGSKRSILADISMLLREGLPPGRRFGLRERQRERWKYWEYQP